MSGGGRDEEAGAAGSSGSPKAVDRGSDESTSPAQSTAQEAAAAVSAISYRAIGPGTELGRYHVVDELGSGGMATVWRARDRELRRDVAIKVLFPHLSKKPDVVRRFDREARAAAALEHPHILRVYDVGGGLEVGGDPPYIVMELVRGQSLRELAEKQAPLLAELVACIGALLCDALAVAHAAGVVHRDVKPGNVMVATGGRLLLADFGVAHIDDDDSLVTRTGALLGTPSFMSPEQASGGRLDGRSDVYSVGATLYQLATASLPFVGSTARVVAQLLRGDRVPPLRRQPAVGAPLSRAIDAMMATDPAARPASALEAARVLREIAATGGVDDVELEVESFVADPAAYRTRRTPEVLARVMRRAEDAVQRRAWPEAMALADRAAAMAPDDAAVAALVARVATGGRRRGIAAMVVGSVGVVAIGGGVAVMAMRDREGVAVASMSDGGGVSVGDGVGDGDGDGDGDGVGDGDGDGGGVGDGDGLGVDAAVVLASVDAAAAPIAAGGRVPRPDRVAAHREIAVVDAGLVVAVAETPADAAVAAPEPAPVDARLIVAMDAWCNVSIDGVAYGRADRRRPITVAPGRHEVVCGQGPGLGEWRGPVELRPGESQTVTGSLLRPVAVTVALEDGSAVVIDGKTYRRGVTATLRPGRYRVEVLQSGQRALAGWVSIPRVVACRLRDRPVLDCYREPGLEP